MPNTLINMYDASGNRVAPAAGATKTFTLPTTGWEASGNYYVQDIEVEGMTEDMNGVFAINTKLASDTVYNEAARCQIRVVDQADPAEGDTNGTITVKVARIPTNPIPCVLIELGQE